MVLWYDGRDIKLPGSLTLTPLSSPQCGTNDFHGLSTAGVNGNCRFRDIGGVRRRNVACCSIGPHGSDLTFISVVGFGTAGSCFAVVFVATYVFFPSPKN